MHYHSLCHCILLLMFMTVALNQHYLLVKTPSATVFVLLMMSSSFSPFPRRSPTVLLRLWSPAGSAQRSSTAQRLKSWMLDSRSTPANLSAGVTKHGPSLQWLILLLRHDCMHLNSVRKHGHHRPDELRCSWCGRSVGANQYR